MEKQLAIVSEDAVYARTLGDYMNGSHVLAYRINVFYSAADYLLFHDDNHVDALLIDERMTALLPAEDEEYRLVLTERRTEKNDCIFMYQAMDVIVKEVYYKLHDSTGEAFGDHELNVYSVTGLRGGCGVTTLSLMMAKVLGSTRNVLFISFDPLISLPPDLAGEKGALGEMIYNLKLRKMLWIDHGEDFIRHGRDFDHISGVHCFEELASLGKEEMRDLFAGLSADGRYDTVVFDLGALPAGAGVAMEKSGKLIVIGEESVGGDYARQIMAASGRQDNIIFASLPYDKAFSDGGREYHDFENTQMFSFAKELVESSRGYMTETINEELSAGEEQPEYVPVRKRFRRLVEKGFTEGFRG